MIKPYEETHMDGTISLQNNPFQTRYVEGTYGTIEGDFGIQIAEDGRVWVCINGEAFIRFTPSRRYKTVGNKLQSWKEETRNETDI